MLLILLQVTFRSFQDDPGYFVTESDTARHVPIFKMLSFKAFLEHLRGKIKVS